MKKLLVMLLVASILVISISSCTSSRKTGCPMTEGIIH